MTEHIDRELLQKYVETRVDEQEQLKIDEHLSECESCFESYLNIIDDWTIDFSVSDSFTDETMELLQKVQPSVSEKNQFSTSKDHRNKTLRNYFLAAGLTIILMFTGVFQMIFNLSDQIDKESKPFSEQLMEIDLFAQFDQREGEQENE
ncbi:anti-sigma factor family protein [Salinibacillus xinjiangensis]|uniref:Putative zinc-finger domain-containing protein n=1 Tax=Salinibacillus xinjiangensis TaxID=1229268 RepID=A0A6G1X8W2_9BACI|nr:zf-HC2 domain-containing protein [Salinibacillus xinjiangensis]MRG87443.1 hypothetical protein [Salinibacillus xinjiangensis]